MSDFEPVIGSWWLPDGNVKVSGYLEAAPDNGTWRLTVDGDLRTERSEASSQVSIVGDTPMGQWTLQYARWIRRRERGRSQMQIWEAQRLLGGAHVEDDARFPAAAFQLPHLVAWLGPTKLNQSRLARDLLRTGDHSPKSIEMTLPNDRRLHLHATESRTEGRFRTASERYAQYFVEATPGLILSEIDQLCLALTHLHAIVANQPMESFGLKLYREADFRSAISVIESATPVGMAWGSGLADPFFDTSEVNVEDFITRWLELNAAALQATAIAAQRSSNQFIVSRLVEAANAVETFAGFAWPPNTRADEEDESIVGLLREHGVKSDLRRYIKKQLELRRTGSLADKLVRLAQMLGPFSASWLLGPSLRVWADVVARLRNSVTHGFELPKGLSHDRELQQAAVLTTELVLRLALLRWAGFSNSNPGRAETELLHSQDQVVASHPNSDLFRSCDFARKYAASWQLWGQRLQPASK